MCEMICGVGHSFVLPLYPPYGGVEVTLAGEEIKFLEDGPYSGQGYYSDSIVPTLRRCVFYHCADVGEWGHVRGEKLELCQQDS